MKNRYILILLFAFVLTIGISQPDPLSTPPTMVATDIAGNEVDLQQILDEGKVVIVDLFAAWCSPCWTYHMQHVLEDAYQQWGPAGTDELVVLGIEAESRNTAAQLTGTSGAGVLQSLGDWTDGISYPLIDDASFNDAFNLSYFPTVIAIYPNRLMFEIRQQPLNVIRDILDRNPGLASEDRDANALRYTGTDKTCSDADIKFILHNNGTKNLTSANIQLIDNGEVILESEWTGNLATYEQTEVSLGTIDYVEETKNYIINVVNESGEVTSDNNEIDATIAAYKNDNEEIIVKIVTDLYPGETTWFIRDKVGRTVASGAYQAGPGEAGAGGVDANTTHYHNVTLENGLGCYSLNVRDSYADGMGSADIDGGDPYPGFEILNASDSSVIKPLLPNDFDFESSSTSEFEYIEATSISTIEGLANIKLFPNPAVDLVTVEFDLENSDALQISVINTMGQVVYQNAEIDYSYGQVQEQINVSNFNAGLYFLEVSNANGEKNTLKFNVIK